MKRMTPAIVLPTLLLLATSTLLATFVDASEPIILTAPASYTESDENVKYGQAVCVDPSGQHVAIGANGYDSYHGLVFLYTLRHRQDQRHHIVLKPHDGQSAEDRSKQLRPHARGSGFGFSCAFPSATSPSQPFQFNRASFVVVGAPGHDVQRGAVYVYRSVNSSDLRAAWQPACKIVAHPNRRSGDLFGWAVAVDAECKTVAVSARGHQANNGQVLLFACEPACQSCRMQTTLNPPDYTDTAGPRGIRIRNNFGASVAMTANGKMLVVGSTGFQQERGAAYVYEYSDLNGNKTWVLRQRLESPANKSYSFFGYKVATDALGSIITVGADGEDDYKGAAYVFRKTNHMALESPADLFVLEAELRAAAALPEDNFGASIAVSGNGGVIAVGAPGTDHDEVSDHGVLYVYQRKSRKQLRAAEWHLSATIKLPDHLRREGTRFAWDVAVSAMGRLIIVTAPDAGHGAGLAMLYATDRSEVWQQIGEDWRDEL